MTVLHLSWSPCSILFDYGVSPAVAPISSSCRLEKPLASFPGSASSPVITPSMHLSSGNQVQACRGSYRVSVTQVQVAKQSPREIIDLSWTFSKFAQTPIGFVFGFFEFVCLFVLGVLSCLVFVFSFWGPFALIFFIAIKAPLCLGGKRQKTGKLCHLSVHTSTGGGVVLS